MKIIGKISMFLATLVIVAHTIIPHQHKAKLEIVLHECFFSDTEETSTVSLFERLGDVIKHVNLGEKHLENYRVSSYDYEFFSIINFKISDILSVFCAQLKKEKKLVHNYHYNLRCSSTENELSSGSRGPPNI